MTLDLPPWNAAESLRQKNEILDAMELASAASSSDWIRCARNAAISLAQRNGTVTIEDVYKVCPRPSSEHPNRSGAVFRGKHFVCVDRKPAERVSRHAAEIKVWQYVGALNG